MLVNQSLWSEFGAVEELTEQAAETISGGYETFTLYNKTGYEITHQVEGVNYTLYAGQGVTWDTYVNGYITFDTDGRNDYVRNQTYDLANGRVYEFQDNNSTPGNPYDIELYQVA